MAHVLPRCIYQRARSCFLFVVLAAGLLFSLPASAEKRVALVIGNGGYIGQSPLRNPPNDARDMSAALKTLGFNVITGVDLDKHAFDDKVHEFARSAAGADVALFFYSGHGMQVNGVNYLIPIDAPVTKEDLDFQTVSLDLIQKQIDNAKTKIIVLDACRNNPFARGLARSMGTRAVNENAGLAVTTATELGSFIAFAAQPGQVASDGAGDNSPFTGSLKAHIATPGLSLSDLMIVVRNDVVQSTNSEQIPWDHSALASRFYFKEGPPAEPEEITRKASDAAEVWGWVRDTSNPEALEQFLARYGDTPFADKAKARLAEVKQSQPHAPPVSVAFVGNAPLRPSKPSYDCTVNFTEAEVKICNTPELSLLDTEMDRLYTLGLRSPDDAKRKSLADEQRQWIKARNKCATDVRCLAAQYQTRIKELKASPQASAAVSPKVRPSFDCETQTLPAEVAVCLNEELARQDQDLDRLYVQKARGMIAAKRQGLVLQQRQWIRDRDTCSSNVACLRVQYRARIEQLQKQP